MWVERESERAQREAERESFRAELRKITAERDDARNRHADLLRQVQERLDTVNTNIVEIQIVEHLETQQRSLMDEVLVLREQRDAWTLKEIELTKSRDELSKERAWLLNEVSQMNKEWDATHDEMQAT